MKINIDQLRDWLAAEVAKPIICIEGEVELIYWQHRPINPYEVRIAGRSISTHMNLTPAVKKYERIASDYKKCRKCGKEHEHGKLYRG